MNLNGTRITYYFIFLILIISCQETSHSIDLNTSLIPQPKSIEKLNQVIRFSSIHITHPHELKNEVEIFKTNTNKYYNSILFSKKGIPLVIKLDTNKPKETYDLTIKNNNISIVSSSNKSTQYALQSLFQLIALNNSSKLDLYNIPSVIIQDENEFKHRGILLDCCRHFFDIKTIKKYIDLLSLYKMNVLHWHLTEDQGWRIEINQYPLLNEIGSWREDSTGQYGGYYTKKEIREIVKYATDRHIEVIPEIELPGHSQAAIASYPNLSCTQDTIKVANEWGVFKEIYCAGNEEVFIFLENIFNEITDLFPSEKIHIGGDEAPKLRWQNCPKCQQIIKQEKLKDEHELQSYFIERIAKILAKKDRIIIGWDEILESDISTPAIIQSWRGFSGGIKAVKSGKNAIISPTSHAYFDYPIAITDLEKVYDFQPIPEELNEEEKKLIIGGECNLWSERINNEQELDQKAFPRLLAMSEVLWRNPTERNYDLFQKKVQDHYQILKNLNVTYGIESPPINIQLFKVNNTYLAKINSKVKGLNYFYHNGDLLFKPISDNNSIELNGIGEITVKAEKNGENYGEVKTQKYAIHKGSYKTISYLQPYSPNYSANSEKTLLDGMVGSLDFRDNNWQGFWENDIEFTIDLDTTKAINDVTLHFYQYINSWILFPEKITLFQSKDNQNWIKVDEIGKFDEPKKRGKLIKPAQFKDLQLNTRHLKIYAKNYGKLPDWHEAAGSSSWLFTDEVIIE